MEGNQKMTPIMTDHSQMEPLVHRRSNGVRPRTCGGDHGIGERAESVGQKDDSADVKQACTKASRTLLWHLRWTVPLHIVLPIGLAWLIRHDPGQAVEAFWAVHAGFPVVLLVTARWWWSRKDELLAVLLVNHVVSFATLMFFAW